VIEALAGLVHQVDRVADGRRGYVAVRVPLGHHPGQVLRRQLLAFRDRLAERRERRHARVGRRRRRLDAGVGVALVVVADEQRVVVPVQRAGNRPEADVRGRPVARHHEDVRVRARIAALPDHRLAAARCRQGSEGVFARSATAWARAPSTAQCARPGVRFLPMRTDVTQCNLEITFGKGAAARLAVKPGMHHAGGGRAVA
jgi:hypothetical protein